MSILARLDDAQHRLLTGELRYGTPEYEEVAALAREYAYGLCVPAWQLPRSEIKSNGYSTDIKRVLAWMGLRPKEREAILAKYPYTVGSLPRYVGTGWDRGLVSKPTYRYSRADTEAILDEAYEICIARARERGLVS